MTTTTRTEQKAADAATDPKACPYCGRRAYFGCYRNGTNGHADDCPRFIVSLR